MTTILDPATRRNGRSPADLHTVAVLDDDEHMLAQMVDRVKEFGLTAVPFTTIPTTVQDAVSAVRNTAHFAICDHKMAGLQGAEIVAALTECGIPALLVSQYKDQEVPEYRHLLDRIPRFITRAEFEHANIRDLLDDIERNLGRDVPERRPYKALIRVDEVLAAGRLIVVVPAWGNEELEMSARALPSEERGKVAAGVRLFGRVNLRAISQDELFITDVHVGDPPGGDDGLA